MFWSTRICVKVSLKNQFWSQTQKFSPHDCPKVPKIKVFSFARNACAEYMFELEEGGQHYLGCFCCCSRCCCCWWCCRWSWRWWLAEWLGGDDVPINIMELLPGPPLPVNHIQSLNVSKLLSISLGQWKKVGQDSWINSKIFGIACQRLKVKPGTWLLPSFMRVTVPSSAED